ncbi:MAG: leucine-rich repeat domain-containing protein [Candidatus Hodarchaeales archaeon]|jgi:Leucine-rich repeat (LRR) protein
MNERNNQLSGMYQGVELYQAEIEVLITLEQLLNKPIPCLENKYNLLAFGFFVENKHVIGLRLSIQKFDILPASINQLTQLQELRLIGTEIAELPESIGELTQLQVLCLDFTKIAELPDFIGELTQLHNLSLSGTVITELPDFIGQLTQLQNLSLSGTVITELPDFIGQLTQLQNLSLSGTAITELPASIGQLTQLHNLDLSGSGITELPASFGQLTQLQNLDLSGTAITKLPAFIDQLTQLQGFSLTKTGITMLPASFDQLTSLKQLFLNKNHLTAFTKQEWQFLSQIKELILRDNSFEVPAFKRVWRETHPEELELREFLEAITYEIFSKKQRDDLTLITKPETQIQSSTRKTKHDIVINVGNSITRAFYVTFIGITALIKLDTEILGVTFDFYYFVSLLLLLGGGLIFIDWLSKKQETQLIDQRLSFITKAMKWHFHNVDQFEQTITNRYFLPQFSITSSRYKTNIGFSTNIVIAGVTTLLFLFFSPSEFYETLNFQISFVITVVVIILALLAIFYYTRYRLPHLRSTLTEEFHTNINNYEKKKLEHEKAEKQEIKADISVQT